MLRDGATDDGALDALHARARTLRIGTEGLSKGAVGPRGAGWRCGTRAGRRSRSCFPRSRCGRTGATLFGLVCFPSGGQEAGLDHSGVCLPISVDRRVAVVTIVLAVASVAVVTVVLAVRRSHPDEVQGSVVGSVALVKSSGIIAPMSSEGREAPPCLGRCARRALVAVKRTLIYAAGCVTSVPPSCCRPCRTGRGAAAAPEVIEGARARRSEVPEACVVAAKRDAATRASCKSRPAGVGPVARGYSLDERRKGGPRRSVDHPPSMPARPRGRRAIRGRERNPLVEKGCRPVASAPSSRSRHALAKVMGGHSAPSVPRLRVPAAIAARRPRRCLAERPHHRPTALQTDSPDGLGEADAHITGMQRGVAEARRERDRSVRLAIRNDAPSSSRRPTRGHAQQPSVSVPRAGTRRRRGARRGRLFFL